VALACFKFALSETYAPIAKEVINGFLRVPERREEDRPLAKLEKAMQKLIEGLHQFQAQLFCEKKELFEKLAHGQKPDALLITCSDSRILPHLFTQAKAGDLFILRNVGNIVPPYGTANGGASATIEYATAFLGIEDIIVCGHSHCGAMNALLQADQVAALPAVRGWLGHAERTRRVVSENYTNLSEPQLLNVAIQENVLSQIENLRTHPAVAARLARGHLRLHGWVYKFETGEVFVYRADKGQFQPSCELLSAVHHSQASRDSIGCR